MEEGHLRNAESSAPAIVSAVEKLAAVVCRVVYDAASFILKLFPFPLNQDEPAVLRANDIS